MRWTATHPFWTRREVARALRTVLLHPDAELVERVLNRSLVDPRSGVVRSYEIQHAVKSALDAKAEAATGAPARSAARRPRPAEAGAEAVLTVLRKARGYATTPSEHMQRGLMPAISRAGR